MKFPGTSGVEPKKQQFNSTFNDPSYVLIDDDTAVPDMPLQSTYGHRIHGGQ